MPSFTAHHKCVRGPPTSPASIRSSIYTLEYLGFCESRLANHFSLLASTVCGISKRKEAQCADRQMANSEQTERRSKSVTPTSHDVLDGELRDEDFMAQNNRLYLCVYRAAPHISVL